MSTDRILSGGDVSEVVGLKRKRDLSTFFPVLLIQAEFRKFIEGKFGKELDPILRLDHPPFLQEPWNWFLFCLNPEVKKDDIKKESGRIGQTAEDFLDFVTQHFTAGGMANPWATRMFKKFQGKFIDVCKAALTVRRLLEHEWEDDFFKKVDTKKKDDGEFSLEYTDYDSVIDDMRSSIDEAESLLIPIVADYLQERGNHEARREFLFGRNLDKNVFAAQDRAAIGRARPRSGQRGGRGGYFPDGPRNDDLAQEGGSDENTVSNAGADKAEETGPFQRGRGGYGRGGFGRGRGRGRGRSFGYQHGYRRY